MSTEPSVRTFLRRAVVIPALFGCLVAAAQGLVDAPAPTAQATVDPTRAAVVQVEEQTTDLTEGMTCWVDPTGHVPDVAVVKDVDGTTAYELAADEAWDAAHAGRVWIQAWCER